MKDMVPELKLMQIKKLALDGKRLDGRALGEFRKFTIEKNIIGTAEGSARVRLGGTEVLVGIKVGMGKPYSNKPDHGMLATSVELRSIAHHTFDPFQTTNKAKAIEISRVVDRGIRESGMIDLESLCLEPGKKVWSVNLDIMVLDHDGNIFDASTLGALAALSDTVVPASDFDLGDDFQLPVGEMPVSTTFVKIGEHVFLDPTATEEAVADARLTITTDTCGSLRAMQKGLSGVLYYEEVTKAIQDSIITGKMVRETLEV